MTRRRVDSYIGLGELECAAEREVLGIMRTAIRERGACTIALSGGETPRGLYRRLAVVAGGESPDWSRVHLCFGDERMVHPDDPESNYGMVRDELISHVPVPAGNIHRIRGERPPDVAAVEYAADLARTLPVSGGRFDVVLLGLGTDGHTASLFPGTPVLSEHEKKVSPVYVPSLGAWRVTVTLPVINGAREVIFLVSGTGKRMIVRKVLDSPRPDPDLPATLIEPADSPPHWMLDADAASLLNAGMGSQ